MTAWEPIASETPATAEHGFSPAFEVARPQGVDPEGGDPPPTPLVFASPHSGRLYPPDMMAAARLTAQDLRGSEDAFVDNLIAGAPALGVCVIRARLARAYIDLNRDAWELDPTMFEDALPDFVQTRTARVAAGLGAIARVAGEGRPIYARKLTFAEAKGRIETAHRPYHDTLDRLLAQARNAHGLAILVDWHSMPAAAARGHRARGGGPCDIVLGDRFGAACGPRLTALMEKTLEGLGYRVRPQHALRRRLHHRALRPPEPAHPRHPGRDQPRALYERDDPRADRRPGASEGGHRVGDGPPGPGGLGRTPLALAYAVILGLVPRPPCAVELSIGMGWDLTAPRISLLRP